jgi:hypothetical protein
MQFADFDQSGRRQNLNPKIQCAHSKPPGQ